MSTVSTDEVAFGSTFVTKRPKISELIDHRCSKQPLGAVHIFKPPVLKVATTKRNRPSALGSMRQSVSSQTRLYCRTI